MIEIQLDDVPRMTVSPYPVLAFGATRDADLDPLDFYFTDKVEVCLRLAAAEDYAIDTIDGREYRTPFPHVFFKFPFRRFGYARTTARNAVHFSYALPVMRALEKSGLLSRESIFVPLVLTGEIPALLQKLAALERCSHAPPAADRIDTACFTLLQEIRFARRTPLTPPDPARARVLAVASLLKCNFSQEIDFDALIQAQSMSRRSFFRHWNKYFKESPAEYLLNLRLQNAARSLRETAIGVRAAATDAGFNSPANFAKVFKKRFGVTPAVYRDRVSANGGLAQRAPGRANSRPQIVP